MQQCGNVRGGVVGSALCVSKLSRTNPQPPDTYIVHFEAYTNIPGPGPATAGHNDDGSDGLNDADDDDDDAASDDSFRKTLSRIEVAQRRHK